MSRRTSQVIFPGNGAKMNTLHRSMVGNGYGTVLLDGGLGGQSSYFGIDNYIQTTGRDPRTHKTLIPKGEGLADKISSKLRNLNIAPPTNKPKVKNISLSI
jgi:hypothetical protein